MGEERDFLKSLKNNVLAYLVVRAAIVWLGFYGWFSCELCFLMIIVVLNYKYFFEMLDDLCSKQIMFGE